MRQSQLVESHVRAVLVSKKVTEEGEVIPYHPTELKVGVDVEGEVDNILFLWPATVIHKIDEESPFYRMNAEELLKKRFEIVVTLEGIVEPSGMSIQARSSYMPDEILWGYRFVNVLKYNPSSKQYNIDYNSFNCVYKIDLPNESAKEMDDRRKKEEKKKEALKNKNKGKEKKTETEIDKSDRGKSKTKKEEGLLTGSTPNLLMPWSPQPYPLYYYPHPQLQGRPPTLSTPLLWPPPPPPPPSTTVTHYPSVSPTPARYNNRRRLHNNISSSNNNETYSVIETSENESKTGRDKSPDEHYWLV